MARVKTQVWERLSSGSLRIIYDAILVLRSSRVMGKGSKRSETGGNTIPLLYPPVSVLPLPMRLFTWCIAILALYVPR